MVNDGLMKAAKFMPQRLKHPGSWVGHIPFVAWLISEMKPSTIVELGTHSGNSYNAMCQAVKQENLQAKCFAVDTWRGDEHAGAYDEDIYQDLAAYQEKHYCKFSTLMRMTFDEAKSQFSDQSIDLLHIDGLHTYEAVKHDFLGWRPKVKDGGVILFHDTHVKERNFGVWRLWDEIKEEYPYHVEFSHSHGLGVLLIEAEHATDSFARLIDHTGDKSRFIDYFAALGHTIQQQYEFEEVKRRLTDVDQARQEQLKRAERLQRIVEKQSAELDKRLEVIEQTDQARKDQLTRAETLQGIVEEQSAELDNRLEVIAETDQVRKDQQERAETLQRIVEEQSAELDKRQKVIAEIDKARIDQLERVDALESELRQMLKKLTTIEKTMVKLGVGKRRIKTPFFDSSYYLKVNPDLGIHGVDPVAHYLFYGYFENRQAVPQKSFFRLLHHAISKRGGVFMTIKKAVKKARREGFSGVQRALLGKMRAPDSTKGSSGYAEWIEKFDTISEDNKKVINKSIDNLTYLPLLSVLMPVYNPSLRFLEEAIESVRSQLYPHWELCIADDASTDPRIRVLLSEQAALDDRIRLVFRSKNGHISEASNSALGIAAGEFMLLMDQDDLLPEHSLYYVAKCLNKNPDADLIYTDEDKISESGERYEPYFKPDFDPFLLLAQNMISHLGVYRTSLVKKLGGFRKGFEGSQDWDLALRVVQNTDHDQIFHIPRILYHWRATEGSTALEPSQKNYAAAAGIKAVEEYFLRGGVKAEVISAPEAPHHNRVIFDCPVNSQPTVCILIPTRDRADILSVCIDSIIDKTTYENYSIVVIDNGSKEKETFNLFMRVQQLGVTILRDEGDFNYSRLNNTAVRACNSDLVCLLNNDVEVVSPGWLEEMVSFALQPNVGCVGARLWYPDRRLQHGGVVLGVGGVAGHSHKYLSKGETGYFCRAVLHQSFSAVTAACLMVKRSIYNEVGGLDEALTVAFNDVDFCLRVRKSGYRNVWTPYAELIHHESLSRGWEDTEQKKARFKSEVSFMKDRWGDQLVTDPAYNSNLSLEHEGFSMAWPPRSSEI